MQTALTELSVAQLKRALRIKEQIEALQTELAGVLEPASTASAAAPKRRRKRRKMSAAARAKISAGQRARWAKAKNKKNLSNTPF